MITLNSFGTELNKDDRSKLYPRCGQLYPAGLARLAKAEDYDQVRNIADCYGVCLVYFWFMTRCLFYFIFIHHLVILDFNFKVFFLGISKFVRRYWYQPW